MFSIVTRRGRRELRQRASVLLLVIDLKLVGIERILKIQFFPTAFHPLLELNHEGK
jgi:hypothetical protein